jgi:uncharacterized coiled-coil protein SlyX
MALKEEIFEQNSTLFTVLDENEVTEIKQIQNSVTAVQTQIDQQKLQLDGLAKVVDQNQARNEEQFVNINTMIVGLTTDVDRLKTTTTNLAGQVDSMSISVAGLEQQVVAITDDIYPRLNNLEVQINANTNALTALEGTIDDQQHSIESINDEIGELKDDVDTNKQQITSLLNRVAILESKIYSPYITKWVQYKISYSNNSSEQRLFNFWALDDVRYGTSFEVKNTENSSFATRLTINRPYPQLNNIIFPGVPVLLGYQVSATGLFPIGPNLFEALADRPAIVYIDQ